MTGHEGMCPSDVRYAGVPREASRRGFVLMGVPLRSETRGAGVRHYLDGADVGHQVEGPVLRWTLSCVRPPATSAQGSLRLLPGTLHVALKLY